MLSQNNIYIYYALYKVVVYELRGATIHILAWSLISLQVKYAN